MVCVFSLRRNKTSTAAFVSVIVCVCVCGCADVLECFGFSNGTVLQSSSSRASFVVLFIYASTALVQAFEAYDESFGRQHTATLNVDLVA